MPRPSINYKKCTACENCIEICPMKCFEKQGKKVIVVKPKECIGCQACVVQCDEKAIRILDDE